MTIKELGRENNMVEYKSNTCNICGCNNPVYEDHMCKEHYDFYTRNPRVTRIVQEKELLEAGCADWSLRVKRLLHTLVHLTCDIPMPLYEHFPLEHIYLTELYTIKHAKQVDVERYKKIKEEFDIPENENIAMMERMLNYHDIETSELGPKEKYQLGENDLPSAVPLILAVIGLFLLFAIIGWIAKPVFQIRGMYLDELAALFQRYIPYVIAFAIVIILGHTIPSQYNFFIERSYNMMLFERVEDNVDLVNQVKYIKERNARAGSYYSTLRGIAMANIVIVFSYLLGGGTELSWTSFFFVLGIVLLFIPLFYAFSELVLFYPVIESMKKKRVSIDLYNADNRGGLKRYHRYLYTVFLYSEGVAVLLIAFFRILPISKAWVLLIMPLLYFRFNHAGWAFDGWVRSIIDFYKKKSAEKARLIVAPGTPENLAKMDALKKIHATGLFPVALRFVGVVLVPYLINQLPRLTELLQRAGVLKP